jgi:glycosyltransferase involved in cell wall biosynthesis
LRRWDIATASRPTRYLANSTAVAERILRHYGREATVCHPPVDVDFFAPGDEPRQDFLLAVGALVPYKRYEAAVETASRLRRRLVMVGTGPDEKRLRAIAAPSVTFRSRCSREELRQLYRTCAAYLQPGEEDFGIASVEAQACGAPIVALGRGGARDIVRDGETGVLYEGDGAKALAEAVQRADRMKFDYTRLRTSALAFRAERFAETFRAALRDLLP